MRAIILLILGAIAAVVVGLSASYALAPDIAVAQAFGDYRAAYIGKDAARVTELTSTEDIRFWDEQRKLALTGSPELVKSLDFRRRSAVIRMRADVLDGRMAMTQLQSADAKQLYAATRDMTIYPKLHEQMQMLFVVASGPDSARGYIRLVQMPGAFAGHHHLLAVAQGLYYNFEEQPDGRWLVDPTPMLKGSARANEKLALMLEPTGNSYLTKSYNQASDPAREAVLWQPLVKE